MRKKKGEEKKTRNELCECVFDTNCRSYFYFYYIVICVNCDVCRCVHVLYKYNLTLYNLIIMK